MTAKDAFEQMQTVEQMRLAAACWRDNGERGQCSPSAESLIRQAADCDRWADEFERQRTALTKIGADCPWHQWATIAREGLARGTAREATARQIELTDELRWILGQPCFALINTAMCLRKLGVPIATRAEDEQAVSIHWMLNLYLEHGPENWRDEAIKIMRGGLSKASPAGPE